MPQGTENSKSQASEQEAHAAFVQTLERTLPAELMQRRQWVVWQWEQRTNKKTGEVKKTRVLYRPDNGRNAKANDARTWGTIENACQAYVLGGWAGIGYVFAEDDPYTGTDLDHCRDHETGAVATWAQEMVDRLNSYAEISPSGTGIHVLTKATLPKDLDPKKKQTGRRKSHETGAVEMYDSGRFFTMTGNHLAGTPATIEERQEAVEAVFHQVFGSASSSTSKQKPAASNTSDAPSGETAGYSDAEYLSDPELLDRARSAKNGEKFIRLYDQGDTSGYTSDSEADLALCAELAFWTNNDPARMDRLFRDSHLYREKWDEQRGATTYGERTIAKAVKPANSGNSPEQAPKATTGKANNSKKGSDPQNPQAPERPVIITNDQELHVVADKALAALVAANGTRPTIFVRGGVLCRVRKNEQKHHLIEPLTGPMLQNEMSKCATFARKWGSKQVIIPPPEYLVKDIMDKGEWEFPALLGLTATPPVRVDGTICTTPGYDPGSGLYYAPYRRLRNLPSIPEHPTADDMAAARAVIDDLIYDLPFVDDAAKANYYALLLTSLLRAAIEGAVPMALTDAPAQGTGKSLAASIPGILATGENTPMQPAPEEAEEWRKTITSALMSGGLFFCLDNVDRTLFSRVLSQAITTLLWEDRLLGTNKKVYLPVRLVWMATGNNIQLGGDLPRRCYWVRLDAKMAQPWLREEVYEFRHKNLLGYVKKECASIVTALLTLARAWYAAGCPEPEAAPVLGGFEEWCRIMSGILAYVGVDGFLVNRSDLYEQADNESSQWEAFLHALHEVYRGAAFTANTIAHDIQAFELTRTRVGTERQTPEAIRGERLREALPEMFADLAGGNNEKDMERSFGTKLGKAIARRVETRYGLAGWRFVRAEKDGRSGCWHYRVAHNIEPVKHTKPHPERPADLADLADLHRLNEEKQHSQGGMGGTGETESKKAERTGNNSAKSAKSADQMWPGFAPESGILNAMPNGGTQSRDLPNTMPANDGTAALDPTRAPIAVREESPAQSEPISLEAAREQLISPTPMAVVENPIVIPEPYASIADRGERVCKMAEKLGWPKDVYIPDASAPGGQAKVCDGGERAWEHQAGVRNPSGRKRPLDHAERLERIERALIEKLAQKA